MFNRSSVYNEDIGYIISEELPWELLKEKRVLISGGNGFLPSYFVDTLLALNDTKNLDIKVYALCRNEVKAKERFADYLSRNDFVLIISDVTKPIDEQIELDYIIHAASQASPIYYNTDPVGTLSANVIGTINLLEHCRKKEGCQFLFISSSEVYGKVEDQKSSIEESSYGYVDPISIRSCYAESKRMGENIAVSYLHQYGIPVRIVRPFHIYGPGMSLNDGRVFADFVRDVVERRDITLSSDGTSRRSFCYTADALIGFYTVLLKGAEGEAYNVGYPTDCSILELAECLVKIFPDYGLKIIRNAKFSPNYMASTIARVQPNISKIKQLGWHPKFSVEAGFKRTVLHYIN